MSHIYTVSEGTSPLILSQPHPGTQLAPGMEDRLTEAALQLPDTDWHIPDLYADMARDLSATVVQTHYSRYVIDLNRDPGGVSLYPGQSVTELCTTTLFDGSPLYQDGQEPDAAEIEDRKQTYWQPYHDALAAQIARVKAQHGYALVYDCHSIRSVVPRFFEGALPMLNLGTGGGSSAAPELTQCLDQTLANGDYSYVINGRFKGGFITRHYGTPADNVHAVQMEIAQTAYMEEVHPFDWREDKASSLKPHLKTLLETMIAWGRNTYGS
ncbi:N-formylglutamate deformylase [Sneathiella chinensis]|uniref:N-formylglutamate deformylase n=1 Tax=Sneathiella chinensis TaxID=349750 RepID=A0ABQ5U3W1_9PROT|nr:N-formylglutamate deformylase [Sneathiella chinensis]GLQ06599.1 N-formylglutamate deformylase [Sneathiella chinensis]